MVGEERRSRPSLTTQMDTDGHVWDVLLVRVNVDRNQFSYIPRTDTFSVNKEENSKVFCYLYPSVRFARIRFTGLRLYN